MVASVLHLIGVREGAGSSIYFSLLVDGSMVELIVHLNLLGN